MVATITVPPEIKPNSSENDKIDDIVNKKYSLNRYAIEQRIKDLYAQRTIDDVNIKALWLLKAVSMIDLTTLSGDDTDTNVKRLCYKAANPIPPEHYQNFVRDLKLTTAAVCVYPSRVPCASKTLKMICPDNPLPLAAVATGFPSGQYPLRTRLSEIEYAVENGATEIDIVLDRSLVLSGQWRRLYDELVEMRKACGNAHMKAILAVGELGTLSNVYKASMVAMRAGSHFIKTSTGKESVNATLPIGLVMCRAIREFYLETGIKIGLKPAGGIKTVDDALKWLILVKEELGDEWLNSNLFRIGASGLLGDIEKWFYQTHTGRVGLASKFAFI